MYSNPVWYWTNDLKQAARYTPEECRCVCETFFVEDHSGLYRTHELINLVD